MNRKLSVFLLVAACSGDTGRERPSGGGDTSRAAINWTVRPDSIGPIPLGVPLDQARAALGDSLVVRFAASDACDHARVPSMPRGTLLMVLRDSTGAPLRVERAEVDSAGVLTAEGAGVGDTEARVLELYRDRVVVQPHKYTGPVGHYLIVTSPRDSLYRIVFETDGQRVLRYRAGRRPAVDFVEGCS